VPEESNSPDDDQAALSANIFSRRQIVPNEVESILGSTDEDDAGELERERINRHRRTIELFTKKCSTPNSVLPCAHSAHTQMMNHLSATPKSTETSRSCPCQTLISMLYPGRCHHYPLSVQLDLPSELIDEHPQPHQLVPSRKSSSSSQSMVATVLADHDGDFDILLSPSREQTQQTVPQISLSPDDELDRLLDLL
jgi:hypothetical protein